MPTSPITAQLTEEHRPEVPERPDLNGYVECSLLSPMSVQWFGPFGSDVTTDPLALARCDIVVPGTRRAEWMKERAELLEEIVDALRGPCPSQAYAMKFIAELDALDAKYADLKGE